METPASVCRFDAPSYRQIEADNIAAPSLQFIRAVAELLETEPDTILAEMEHTVRQASLTLDNETAFTG